MLKYREVMLMKISSQKNKNNKKVLVVLMVVICAALIVGVAAFTDLGRQNNDSSEDNPLHNGKSSDINQGISNNPKEPLLPTQQDNDSDQDTDENVSESIEAPVITRSEVVNGNVRVSAILNSASSGSCKLVMSKGDRTIEKSARIIIGPTYYGCDGFRFSTDELGEDGKWSVYVVHEASGKTAKSEVKTIDVE